MTPQPPNPASKNTGGGTIKDALTQALDNTVSKSVSGSTGAAGKPVTHTVEILKGKWKHLDGNIYNITYKNLITVAGIEQPVLDKLFAGGKGMSLQEVAELWHEGGLAGSTTQVGQTPSTATPGGTVGNPHPPKSEAWYQWEIAARDTKLASAARLTMKVSEKGALSVYASGRFPVTLYRDQWERYMTLMGCPLARTYKLADGTVCHNQIYGFILDNAELLKVKEAK